MNVQPEYIYSPAIWANLDKAPLNATVHIDTDPPSGVALFSVYTDDGRGNGDCLLSLPLSELLKLASKVGALSR